MFTFVFTAHTFDIFRLYIVPEYPVEVPADSFLVLFTFNIFCIELTKVASVAA